MYNIKLSGYIEEPKPPRTDRIVAAHYYAAWKKGAAGIHEGFDDLAEEYPERTPLMGYYDEENPEVADFEIKWALEHGINCFIHCWYRKKECEGKPIKLENLRCAHGLHEAFFNAKYRQMMNFAIMFEASPRWAGTDEVDMLENLMPFWMENYFKRENYLVIDNKPVLFVYQQTRLADECFKSAESQRATFDACREYAKQYGFDGMIFAACKSEPRPDVHADLIARGYDLRFGYNSGFYPPYDHFEDEEAIMDAQCALLRKNLAVDARTFIATPSCFADPTPRRTKRWCDLGYKFREVKRWYLTPENYRRLLERMKAMTDALPEDAWGRRIMMIDNWNEWDEGHFVAPSHKFGFKFLQAIREVLTKRNNLPDYVMPQDAGFGGYNTSWRTPDFTDVPATEPEDEEL